MNADTEAFQRRRQAANESDDRTLAETRLAPPGEHDLFYASWDTGIWSILVMDGTCRAGRRGEALALGEFDVPATVDP